MDSPLSLSDTSVPELSGSREELSVLVQGDGHDPVGCVERLLDSVTVMDIDVDVQHSLVVSQKLEDTEDDV